LPDPEYLEEIASDAFTLGRLDIMFAIVNSITVSESFRLWGELPMPSETRKAQEYGRAYPFACQFR